MTSQDYANWIAVDWGTSNLRAWAMDASGQILKTAKSNKGMGALKPSEFEPALLSLIEPWIGDTAVTVVACGMVGARQGWAEADYLKVPTAPAGDKILRVKAVDPRLGVRILPGVSQTNPPDVMRGEETQIAGLLHHNPDFNGIACLPGTHTKWVQIVDGEIFHFATFMTGELFALLETRSVLRDAVAGNDWDEAAFTAALDEAISAPERIANRLFSIRASGLLLGTDAAQSRATLSGLLVGLELGGARPYWLGQDVAIIGGDGLVDTYARALEHVGLTPRRLDGTEMVLNGLSAAYQKIKGQSDA